jgi:sulfur-oxidizing protein SoxX
MKRAHITAAVIAALAAPAFAQQVAPTQVEWVDEVTIPDSLSGVPGDVENGKILMNKGAGNCIACHAVTELADLQFHGEIGPSLDGVADRWTEAELRGIVADAKRMFPESMMPSFYRTEGFIRPGNAYTGKPAEGELQPLLTAQEIEDVVSYLMTLNYTN